MTGEPVASGASDDALARLLVPARVRALELHEALAHAHGRREVRDLGDAILLHDPTDPDPFVNRLSALRLPSDLAECDSRLAEFLALFATLARRPHFWMSPAFHSPPDLAQRLAADGFVEYGGTFMLVLTETATLTQLVTPRTPDVRMERLSTAADGAARRSIAERAATVMIEAFGALPETWSDVVADLAAGAAETGDVVLVSVGEEPVAAGRRFTSDGLTYLSSIGTRPRWWGRGFAAVVTATLATDGRESGGPIVHLGVETENTRAQRLYARLGFRQLGSGIADLLLA